MPQIEELRRQRAGINEQVQALATIDASGSTLTAEQLTEFANLQQQFTDISAKIERLEAAERAAALVAKPVKATQQAPGIIVKQEPKQYTGAGMTRLVMSVAAGAGNLQDAAKFASEELNDQSVSMAISTAAASGGVLIPQNLHSEVIELLSDRTIVRKLGARPVPLPNGNMTLPRVAGGATASYTGENKDAKTSETRFDDVKLTAKTLIAMVPISNALIGRAGFNVEQLVLQDILTAISVREDKAFMRDDGKSLKLRRDENNSGNSDKQLGTWQSVREDAKFRFEFWAMMPADQAPSSGWTTLVGIQSQNAAGQNAWQAAVTVSEASLGARDKWVKFTGIASNNGAGRTRAVVWISTRGATGNGTPGYSLYIDDLVITDVTDAKAAQDASDATASAVSGLTARVTDAEGKITAQAQQQTALATKVDNANSRVDNMAKTLSDSQSTQASLNTSLQSQIDAQAAANIKNQTTLDNTIKSVASITSTQQTHATALEALATQQTTLTSSVGDLSASVQNTAKTVADVNGTVSSLWSMKVETVNGKNVGAGITLGSNGETSDMILYADRFSLFNRNNATAVPVMIAEGNELYIDTARIKNSSLTSTKIADGSITNAKIGNEIRSNNFVDGSQGWRIAKDGSSQFNNVIVRGRVEANSGVFRGTVQADAFIGDIAVAKGYDSLTFRRNQTVQRNGAYQNRGYSMTVVLACTLVCQTYGTGSGLGYTSDITFNIGGQEVTRRIFVDAGNITAGTTAFELRFAARLDADYNNVGFFIKATGRNAAIDYTCTVENITATAFRTDSSSFS
ncbi:phage major capsid protein [Klebsiella variicola]|nr:phage major capsid protein [Klebsiella variicola]